MGRSLNANVDKIRITGNSKFESESGVRFFIFLDVENLKIVYC